MLNEKFLLPLDIYYEHLQAINDVTFTPREIDIIACLLNRRATSISSFLSIGSRAVETHTRNIRQKAGGLSGRENIITFIENSGKLSIIKNDYYASLRCRVLFEEQLKALSQQIGLKNSPCLFVYERDYTYKTGLLLYLKEHLKRIGFTVEIHISDHYNFLIHSYLDSQKAAVYLVPDPAKILPVTSIDFKHFEKMVFVFQGGNEVKNLKGMNSVSFLNNGNYYLSFFDLLKKLLPDKNLDSKVIENFIRKIQEIWIEKEEEIPSSPQVLESTFPSRTNKPLLNQLNKTMGPLICILIAIIIFFSYWPSFTKDTANLVRTNLETIQSDLLIPAPTTLLNRSQLLAEIKEKLKGSEGIQTVSLVGWGGAGKTTLARQYARQQDRPLIWEVNAETKKSLMASLEALAYAASKTSEEKKELREIQDIKNPSEREGQLLIFLKRQLKAQPNWFLIYDNVESLTDIQPYFPYDAKIWGKGHVLITTQNMNITKNSYIENMGVLTIGELSETEKLSLFNKIISSGESKVSSLAQEDLHKKNFLKKVPPFPLDVSTAAYYLKETQVSYDQYLAYLSTQTVFFDENQHNLLRDVGKYTKTRYAIISMSLKQIIEAHKNYKDMLLLISLIDSQNIPKELILSYENNDFGENFLHELKKRSFIIEEASKKKSKIATFSLHRSVQNIFLSCLTKKYELQENHPSLHKILNLLEKYLAEKTDQEDLIKISPLRDHCEKILTHTDILSPFFQDSIKGDLGTIYFYLGRYDEAIVLLRQSIDKLQRSQKNFYKLGRLFAFLASAYIALGDVKEGIEYHCQSIALFQKYFPHHYLKIALHLTYLGNAYRDFGQYEKARETLEKAYTIFKIKSLQSNVGYARNLIDLGKVYRALGEYKRAIPILKEGFAYYKHHLSADHFRSAWGAIHLAHTYNDVKMHHEARELLEYALLNYEGNHSKNHIGVAWILTHLGYTYKELHQYEKARLLFNRARAIYQKNVPDDHIEVAWTLVGLGSLDTTTEALRLVKKNLAIYQKNYGKDHVETARVLVTLGEIYSSQGDLDKAEVYLREASQIFEKHKHPDNYTALEALADLSFKKSSHEKETKNIQQAQSYERQGINYLSQALEIVKKHFPENSPHIMNVSLKLEKVDKKAEIN